MLSFLTPLYSVLQGILTSDCYVFCHLMCALSKTTEQKTGFYL
jgi:hypothetical protein